MSTAQDLPVPYGEPAPAPAPALRLVPVQPLDFDDAVLHLRPRLHRYAVRRLGDSHEAEELVQEALLRAYTHREQLSTADDLAAWATVVTGRLVIDRLRVRGRFTPVADLPEGSRVGRDTADVVVARDEARLALDALDAMPSRQAALLWAREVEGQSYDELCTRFGMTEPAVRSVLTRARKALRKEYASRGGTLPVGGLAVLAPWIAGLSWADRLREAANRITAPAALGAAGVTVLGGLVLSPFGDIATAPSHQDFRPSQAVVVSAEPNVPHGFVVAPASASPTATLASPHVVDEFAKALHSAGQAVTGRCIDNQEDGALPSLVIPGSPVYAGSPKCDVAEDEGTTITFTPVLPDNPTGLRQVGITSTEIDCAYVPETPLARCTPETQQGASQ